MTTINQQVLRRCGTLMLAALVLAGGSVRAADSAADLPAMQSQLQQLQARTTRVWDLSAIKRLQRAYGYYVDKGQWDEVANLFADNATLEIARDGVYIGKQHIRSYFYALGGGKQGWPAGRLYENLLVMPVITLADDGLTAKARWRDIMLNGQFGQHGEWGEGPFENEYVKQDGVWKLSKVRWQQSFLTAYAGGWVKNEDYNKGIWVSDKLKPDAPPTEDHGWWPQTWLLPFHFKNPVLGVTASTPPIAAKPVTGSTTLTALSAQAAALRDQIVMLEAEHDIENLQGIFGFYYDKNEWQQAADLFTDDATFEWGGSGVYVGKARILGYLNTLGKEGPQEGILNDQMQLQPVITVAANGKSAKARWHQFSQEAIHKVNDFWATGVYENEYRNENGVWKISKLKLYSTMKTRYADGWGKTALPRSKPNSAFPPDRPPSTKYENYPAVFVPPYHYANPVTDKTAVVKATAGNAADAAALRDMLASLGKRVGLMEDAVAVERLHTVYGHYLAHYKMDDLAGIFADDATIEVALRGVYIGKASVRRNLDLYGPLDLHNHMQFQPVIHIQPDGQTALMRSRAFSIMGSFGGSGTFMGGIYENKFVKRNGVWMLLVDHVINTYFSVYDVGWKEMVWRPAPGISKDNPPDAPPSMQFEMYPRPFLPPYHYKNPVTGK